MTGRVWGVGVAALATLVLTVAAVAGEITVHLRGDAGVGATLAAVALALVGASWFTVGAYLAVHRPRHPLGWLFLVVGLGTQAGVAVEIAGRAGWSLWLDSPTGLAVDFVIGSGIFLLLGLLPVLYPNGTLGRAIDRAAALCTTIGAVLAQAQVLRARIDPDVTWPFGPSVADPEPVWLLWLPFAVYLVGVVAGWVLCVARLVRSSHPLRQQLAWMFVAIVAVMVTALLGDSVAAMSLQALALLLLPVAIGVGIVRYQLLGIETALPQVITAGVLGLTIAAVYVAVAASFGAGITGATVPSVLAAAAVAALLLPLQARVRRMVDRFVYGKRADPVRAVADLGAVVAARDDDVLVAVLEEVAATFRARGARIWGVEGDVVATTRSCPDEPATGLTADLVVAGAVIGRVELLAPERGGSHARGDLAMLTTMAGTVALAVRAASLADELEAQRDAVVEASAVARDRLRRDLHDGLGPSLTGLRLGLQALADARAAGDDARVAEIARVLSEESERAVVEVRRIIDDLRPGDLDGSDLVAALRRRLDRGPATIPVRIDAGDLPALPARVEDGVFRVVTEAVANAHRHAAARAVGVEVRRTDAGLLVRVNDDGVGIAATAPAGVGLASMRARAAELGGTLEVTSTSAGTTVTLRVPLRPVEAAS